MLICLATYNERDNLGTLVPEILSVMPTAEVLVIDDHSPDGTGQLADELSAKDPRVHVIHRAGKLGLGTALVAAIRYGMEHGFDLLLTMDADYSHHPRYLPALTAGMTNKDIMIGSRYVRGGGTHNWPWSRLLISRSVNLLVRLLMRIPVRDCSGGFRCYRLDTLRQAELEALISHGYSFQQEVLHRCHQVRAKIGETPIIFEERRAGVSKVNWWESIRSLSILVYLGSITFFGFNQRLTKQLSTKQSLRQQLAKQQFVEGNLKRAA